MEQIINAIEATNATVDQLVQQGNELCDDVDNLRAADERLGKEVEAIRASVAANKEAIASQAKDLADIRAIVADLRSGLANDVVNLQAIVEAQAKEIADLRAIVEALRSATPATPAPVAAPAQTTDMAALIARIPKPDAVRTRAAAAQPVVETVVETPAVVEVPAVAVVEAPAPRKAAPRKDAVVSNAVETRAYARQYMIENGAKVEQLRDPAAIEATVASEDFAAWLAAR